MQIAVPRPQNTPVLPPHCTAKTLNPMMAQTTPNPYYYHKESSARKFEPGLRMLVEGSPSVVFKAPPDVHPRSLQAAIHGSLRWFKEHPEEDPALAGLKGCVRTRAEATGVRVFWFDATSGRYTDYAQFEVPKTKHQP
jgi:hypothetical protein